MQGYHAAAKQKQQHSSTESQNLSFPLSQSLGIQSIQIKVLLHHHTSSEPLLQPSDPACSATGRQASTNQLDHRGPAVPLMGQRKAAKPKSGQHQDTAAQLPPLQQPAAAMDTAGAPPAPAAAAGMPAPPDVTLGTLQQLEEKKKRLGHQLKDVERQVRRGLVVWDT